MTTFNSTTNVTFDIDGTSPAAGATIFFPVIMFLAGVLGNIWALCQLRRTRIDVRTTHFYSLVTGLVWTDLIGIIMTSPSVILAYVNGLQWQGGDIHCRFHGFSMIIFGIATPVIICAMAVERFIAVKCVFFYSSRCRSMTASCWLLFLWLVVILYGLLPLIGFGKFIIQHPGTWCYIDYHSHVLSSKLYAYIYAFVILLLTFIICICNTYVAIIIFKTRRLRRSDRQTSNYGIPDIPSRTERSHASRTTRCGDMDVQMVVLLCALAGVFAVCWTPLMVQIIVTIMTGTTNHIMDLTVIRLASLNQTLDPWLYIILRRSFWGKLWNCFTNILTKCTPSLNPDRVVSEEVRQYQPVGGIDAHGNNVINDREDVHTDRHVGHVQRGGQPDIMSDTSDSSRSPLPDVTHTHPVKTPGYMWRLQLGKSALQEKGICVRIFCPSTSILQTTRQPTPVGIHGNYPMIRNTFNGSGEISVMSHSDQTMRKTENSSLRKTKSSC